MKKSVLASLWLSVACFILSTATVQFVSAEGVDRLNNTSWRLVEFQSMDDSIGIKRPESSSQYTMRLNADGTVNMRLNCNRAHGRWSAKPGGNGSSGNFEFGQLAATRALCPPPSMDESIVAQAQYIRSYLFEGERLYLSLMADAGIYVWEQQDIELSQTVPVTSPEEGGALNWKVATTSGGLNLRERPSTSAETILTYPAGTLLNNLGCQQADDRVWCSVQAFHGGAVGFVAADYLAPAVSPNGSVITGPDESALRAGRGDFDARGTVPCAIYRGQPMSECAFGVARTGGGYATVVIEKPDSVKRAIFFMMGIPISADVSEADGSPEFKANKEADLHLIRIGNERYEIPDAVVLGG